MCKFCENEENYSTLGEMKISAGIFGKLIIDVDLNTDCNAMAICASRAVDGICDNSKMININFCPMCGRDLKKGLIK